VRIIFNAMSEGSEIILDTKHLVINKVIDSNTGLELLWKLDTEHGLDSLGTPLVISKSYNTSDKVEILINYSTTNDSTATQWYSPEMTLGKEYPFMYTQCEAILCRSLIPIQDTPSAKVRVTAKLNVKKPLVALYAGVNTDVVEHGDTISYYYTQNIPIPSYLIAIAVGKLESRRLSHRIAVYAEKEMVDKSANEFAETEKFIQYAESYLTPYEWTQYNLLVLPPGFPYGGMENPTLTFVTPSLIAGDRSLANVIAHEIAHSWTGNLVTNKNWQNFWLNEGFTVFVERKIIELIYGEEMSKLQASVGYDGLTADIKNFGENHSYTSLYPDIQQNDPDDAFSSVPYEKGFNFLYYLQSLVGKKEFRKILRNYINKYRLQSIGTDDWKDFFINQVKTIFDAQKSTEILKKVDWDSWINKPGFPPISNDFSNVYLTEAKSRADDLLSNKIKEDFVTVFKSWHTNVKLVFLGIITNSIDKLSEESYIYLNDTLKLNTGYNFEVQNLWFQIALNSKHKDSITFVKEFLRSIGRMKYIRPIYQAFAKLDKEQAYQVFLENKHFYHPLAVRLIENDFKNIQNKLVDL
jgi:leukotriene-A4 hydrolase